MVTRIEMSAAVGLRPGTFWKRVLAYQAAHPGTLAPSKIEDCGNFKKFYYDADRTEEFKAALSTIKSGQRGRPIKTAVPNHSEGSPS